MSKFIIEGGRSLEGEVQVSGSKNAALPILASTLLVEGTCVVTNVPDIQDIRTLADVLVSLGCRVEGPSDGKMTVDASRLDFSKVDFKKIKRIRASVLLIAPLLARLGKVKIPHPGGCHIGARPIDFHLNALRDLGAKVDMDDEFYYLETDQLVANKIVLGGLSVTGTSTAILGAVLAEGISEIRLAAVEPENINLIENLIKMGAKIEGIGTHTLKITGVKELSGTDLSVIPDRLEAGTFAIMAAVAHGDVLIKGYVADHLDAFTNKLKEANVQFDLLEGDQMRVRRTSKLKPVNIKTEPYPGFPTDLQAPFGLLLSQAEGTSEIFETIFDSRLNYFKELSKMGANANIIDAHHAVVTGPSPLYGKEIESLDIRAGATLILAALAAHGKSVITHAELIDRGYENIDAKLRSLGAKIERVEE